MPADVSTVAGAQALAAEIGRREPQLDILVNNAGAAWGAPYAEFPGERLGQGGRPQPEDAFLPDAGADAVAEGGASAARPSKVINIASIDGISVNPQETYSYAASKAGLIHLTRRMALHLVKEHIVVSAIAPGAFASDMNRAARDEAERVAKRIPSQRIGVDDDMAGAAIYLASRAGDYVVGAASWWTAACRWHAGTERGVDLPQSRAGSNAENSFLLASVMNFAEGTRFTPQKHQAQGSPYRHLLKPIGGCPGAGAERDGGEVPLAPRRDDRVSRRCTHVLAISLRPHAHGRRSRHATADPGRVLRW